MEKIDKIRNTPNGEKVQIHDDLYLFRVPKQRFRHGQSYGLIIENELVLIDTVHQITKDAVESLRKKYAVKALILTHSDLVHQAFGSVGALKEWLGADVFIHPKDYKDEQTVDITKNLDFFRKLNLEIFEIPGHTPGSIAILDHSTRRLYSGDAAVGNNYEKADSSFTHPPISDADWHDFVAGWNRLPNDISEIYPLHGKPDLSVSDFSKIRERLTMKDNVMGL